MSDIIDADLKQQEKGTITKGYKWTLYVERTLLIISLLAIIYGAMGLAGHGFIYLAVMGSLSILYFFVWPIVLGTSSNRSIPILSIVVSIALSISVVGILFRNMMWPFGIFMARSGLLICTVLLLVNVLMLFVSKSKGDKVLHKWPLPRLLVVMVPLSFSALIGPVDHYKLVGEHRDDPQFIKLMEDCIERDLNCEEYRAYNDSVWREHNKPENIVRRQLEEEKRLEEQEQE